jgi:hypothetical protein
MTAALSVTAYQTWRCPECGLEERTEPKPNRFHTCPRLRYLTAPMVLAGTDAKVSIVERQDYVGNERVMLDPELHRPVMSIVTERADGSNDVMVFAPAATARQTE